MGELWIGAKAGMSSSVVGSRRRVADASSDRCPDCVALVLVFGLRPDEDAIVGQRIRAVFTESP
jgi:hypothetical protein